jgi:hypothetical protein
MYLMSSVRQQGQAGGAGKVPAYQEVAVAGHPVHGHAAVAYGPQGVDDALMEGRAKVVVTGPVFEDVAEQVERVGLGCALGQEAEKGLGRARMRFLQVQVGNEERKRARGTVHGFSSGRSHTQLI